MQQTTRLTGAMLAVVMILGMETGARAQQPDTPMCATLPDNIEASPRLRRHVSALMARSATLRRQCALIAAAPEVRVVLRHVNPMPVYCRARAYIQRESGELRVAIELPVSSSFPELLAHELEHVIEAIEGIDLAARAREHGSGVVEILAGVFETRRAKRAGHQAEAEVFSKKR